ncbi:dihydrodipicolinate synthase family protein [Halegenticoccus soli]|uniref:dihydrodipicolinate synthase family protein n=1 Tax=Halegenticoccus soli TaxID=1985678 RepID=UPI000C6EA38D|nr:dihydrodipicolinate synthase family protein [Halegenticoccus soli]
MQRQSEPTQLEVGLRDVATGILTPFGEEDGEIRYDALRSNVQALYDAGVRTFLACANISEYHSLSHEERITITEESVDALAADACVLAGAGGSLKTTTRLIGAFERTGVDGIMVMPPMHAYKHEQGLLRYYRELAEVADTGIIPYIRGFSPSVEFLAALTHIDNVAGIKYALDDIVTFREAISAGSDDVIWVAVTETLAPEFYMEGAEGFTAGVSNFRPEIGLALMEALEAGDFERAKEIRDVTLEYQRFRTECGHDNTFDGAVSIPAVKYGLELAGLTGGAVRPPLVELSHEDKARAEEMYHRIEAADVP